MPEWKDTVNLPRTDFPMKASLPATEPQEMARWESIDLYGKIGERRRGAPKFVFHDGPPYANGNIHMGTALNKILKDFVVKSHSMAGFDAPYIPGYDCHGLPIELQVDRELGPKKRELSTADFRRACRAYAERFIDAMTQQFKRLGIFGDWSAPYLTMNFRYQASIVRALGRFVERGLVYKGKKPVHWCVHCRTALAEAEVEYEDHTSPSIYVEFPLAEASADELASRMPGLAGRPVSVLIWTTTPWTIPSNLAVAFHPELDYAAYDVDGRAVIVAEELAATVAGVAGRVFGEPLARAKGAAFEHVRFRHPLYARDSLGVLGDYVTLDAGTGAVHTAPGHGADDFNTGVKYGLEIYAPIGPSGHFHDTVELVGGLQVFEANAKVEDALHERARLWHRQSFSHQYPHCWRCHNPVIFLATSQWFIRMDGEPVIRHPAEPEGAARTLRAAALDAIDHHVRWVPAWGHDRIYNMIAFRPDWCISRQRAWGVPIPAVDCAKCGEALLTPALVERAAAVFDTYGADAWYERPVEEFLPPDLRCPACQGTTFERERDILDVWFDSGSSHEAVLPFRPELRWPADTYLEGSDQHRGWFQSSLLVSMGTRGQPPFRDVVTHGFIVAEDGRKMSKSLGNSIEPQDIIKQSGADILRLWVSMSDYTQEVRLSKDILARAVEAYRKFRNTLRYLAANLYDFDPARDATPLAELEDVDRYALGLYGEVASTVVAAYDRYDYPTVFHTISTFLTVDLSAFYFDVSKDRMYTYGAASRGRRSGQTAMHAIVDGLVRLLAPILPVTCDQLWRALPGDRSPSVHLEVFPTDTETLVDRTLVATWTRLRGIREHVTGALELVRQQKTIGTSLEAAVSVAASGDDYTLLVDERRHLPMLFIVSDVDVVRLDASVATDAVVHTAPVVTVRRADGTKCVRCWRYVPAVASEEAVAGLCPRCVDAVAEHLGRSPVSS
ncbi:MAG: isoleucine--tRNA ligase [Vicinamibacterales bacterium]